MFDLLTDFLGGKIAVILAGACLALVAAVAVLVCLLLGQAERTGALEAVNKQNAIALSLSATAHKATDAAMITRKEKEHAIKARTEADQAAIDQAGQQSPAAGAWLDTAIPDDLLGLLRATGDANRNPRPGAAGGAPAGNAGAGLPGPAE